MKLNSSTSVWPIKKIPPVRWDLNFIKISFIKSHFDLTQCYLNEAPSTLLRIV